MIANVTKGSSPQGLLEYVYDKEESQRLSGNLGGRNPKEMAREWQVFRSANDRVKKDVWHCSLSLAEEDELSEEEWREVVDEFRSEMGFDNSAWVAFRHEDTKHDHVHFIGNRVDCDGRAVDISHDYQRTENLCRQFELVYDLKQVEPSREKDEANLTRGEREMAERGEESIKSDLQDSVREPSYEADTMSEYARSLEERGVAMQLRRRDDGTPYGASYVRTSDGAIMKGSDLGRAYAWGGLQRKAEIDYDRQRDHQALQQSERRAERAIEGPIVEDRQPEEESPEPEDRQADQQVSRRDEEGIKGVPDEDRADYQDGYDLPPEKELESNRESGRELDKNRPGDVDDGRNVDGSEPKKEGLGASDPTPDVAISFGPDRDGWQHRQVREYIKERGLEFGRGEVERGEVAETEVFDDRRMVLVVDGQGRFDIVDVPESESPELAVGDDVQVERDGEPSVEKDERNREASSDRKVEQGEAPGREKGEDRGGRRRGKELPSEASREDLEAEADELSETDHTPDRSSPNARRERWREQKRLEYEEDGREYEEDEVKSGEVSEIETVGDQTMVLVVDDDGRFDIVDVPESESPELEVGDDVQVERERGLSIEKDEPERGWGLEL